VNAFSVERHAVMNSFKVGVVVYSDVSRLGVAGGGICIQDGWHGWQGPVWPV